MGYLTMATFIFLALTHAACAVAGALVYRKNAAKAKTIVDVVKD